MPRRIIRNALGATYTSTPASAPVQPKKRSPAKASALVAAPPGRICDTVAVWTHSRLVSHLRRSNRSPACARMARPPPNPVAPRSAQARRKAPQVGRLRFASAPGLGSALPFAWAVRAASAACLVSRSGVQSTPAAVPDRPKRRKLTARRFPRARGKCKVQDAREVSSRHEGGPSGPGLVGRRARGRGERGPAPPLGPVPRAAGRTGDPLLAGCPPPPLPLPAQLASHLRRRVARPGAAAAARPARRAVSLHGRGAGEQAVHPGRAGPAEGVAARDACR